MGLGYGAICCLIRIAVVFLPNIAENNFMHLATFSVLLYNLVETCIF